VEKMKLLSPWAWLAGITLILALLATGPAAAHTEGKIQLASEAAGPYKLTVWTSPEPASVGELHVAVAAVLAEDASPVLDAGVLVELAALEDSGQVISAEATAEDAANKFLREAIFKLTAAGRYLATITVNGVDGATGSASFEFDVVENGGSRWPLFLLGFAAALGAAALIWFTRNSRAQTN
jgi:hypothetical protein